MFISQYTNSGYLCSSANIQTVAIYVDQPIYKQWLSMLIRQYTNSGVYVHQPIYKQWLSVLISQYTNSGYLCSSANLQTVVIYVHQAIYKQWLSMFISQYTNSGYLC
jgi:hypothetical protein